MSYAADFRTFIQTHIPEKAQDNTTYSGSSKTHYGLSNPTMRNFVKDWAKNHPKLSYDDWQITLSDLYQGQSIDECCFAGFLLGHYAKFRRQVPLPTLDTWISCMEGWREIDTTCQSNYTAKDILSAWDNWHPFLIDLSQRQTAQHQRASLVLLVKPIRDDDDPRLITTALANVERLKPQADKLITKAISWILREALKQHRQTIAEYVQQNADTLPAIAVREFNKKYQTGKK